MILFGVILLGIFSFLILYTYLFFPLIMRILSNLSNKKYEQYKDTEFPFLIVIFSAFNEEKVIEEKLSSLFKTTYPTERFLVYCGSDCSTDNTNQIISKFVEKHSNLLFYPFKERRGKNKVISQLIDTSRSYLKSNKITESIVIMTDANVMFTETLFYEISRYFGDKSIGQVAANIINRGVSTNGISKQEEVYISGENELKNAEGKLWGSMMGAFGACYAIRPNLLPEVPPTFLMEDFFISMHVLKSGYKAIVNLNAICYEDLPNEIREEYKRKSRISAGNYQNLIFYFSMLFKFNTITFTYWSHKVLRWLTPYFLLLNLLILLILTSTKLKFVFVLIPYCLLLFSPIWDKLLLKLGVNSKWLRFPSYFVMMNLALLNGLIMYIKGVKSSVWAPTKRNVIN